MKFILYIILIASLISCQNDLQKLKGNWGCQIDCYNINHPMFPFDMVFYGDTIDYVTGEGRRIRYNIKIEKDSMYFIYRAETPKAFAFEMLNDSVFRLDHHTFWRHSEDNVPHIPLYSGLKRTTFNKYQGKVDDVFYVFKENNKLILQLNDTKSGLDELPSYLHGGHRNPIKDIIGIYLGEDVTMQDLLSVYAVIYYMDRRKIKLIFSSNVFDLFVLRDSLGPSDYLNQLSHNEMGLPPMKMEIDFYRNKEIVLEVFSSKDFSKINSFPDGQSIHLRVSSKIDILEYFELLEFLEKHKIPHTKEFM
ncbi:MAG: hypothetical protein ACPG6V_04845 [Flavobacteriales bacterium]